MNACPKPRPKLLDKREKQAGLRSKDDIQKARVRKRSGGQCEVQEQHFYPMSNPEQRPQYRRCPRRSAPGNHHLIGGSGRRNKNRSILAEHRLAVCDRCHDEITNHVLVPVDGTKKEDAATVRYERVH